MSPLAKEMFAIGSGRTAEEVQELLAEANEGVDSRLTQDEVDRYAEEYLQLLEKAQRANPPKAFVPPNEGEF